MVYEFEGRTEKEAIDRAAETLGLGKDDFDVEILEVQRTGLFKLKKGYVKIRVHLNQPVSGTPPHAEETREIRSLPDEPRPQKRSEEPEAQNDFEQKIIDFIEGVIHRMGYEGKVSVLFREDRKIGFKVDSEHSSILIGKKGKNLDALQLLINIYAGRQGREDIRVILDTENYRIRREESLVRLAYTVADRV
ncbi:MAG: KH domain-containing protein, partial [Treponema sp.]|nr:KH domain-containing protein [Treponema sp.]